jgi:CheY-like chemotaxis protein
MAQAIGNLLNNAAKYTPEGGRISAVAAREGDFVVLRVQDSGIGIPEDMLEHVFEPFLQLDPTLDHKLGGLGNGLTLVRTVVELHGGSVEARSAGQGKGSEFIIRLPARSSAERLAATEASSTEGRKPLGRVLIVEDNLDSAETLRLLLSTMGYEVKAVHDGLQGLQAACEFRPPVAVIDIGLPLLDGYELARRLRAHPETSDTLLIALTGYGQEDDRRRALEAGFDHHLVKPTPPEKLIALIEGSRGGER